MEQNLNSYKIFYQTAKLGNITRASEQLFISQPAISKSISKLEQSLGVVLFSRSPRGVVLTDEGEVLYERLSVAFEAIDEGEQRVKNLSSLGVGKLRIGASSTLSKYVLINVLKGFVNEFPHIKIVVDSSSSSLSLQKLYAGKIDVALIPKPEQNKNLVFLPLNKIEDIFVASKNYLNNFVVREQLVSESEWKFNEEVLIKSNLMMLNEENMTRRHVDSYLRDNNIALEGMIEVTSMDLLIDFAKIGLGVACVVKEFVEDDLNTGELVELKLSTPINKRTVGIAYLSNAYPTVALTNLINYLKGINHQFQSL